VFGKSCWNVRLSQGRPDLTEGEVETSELRQLRSEVTNESEVGGKRSEGSIKKKAAESAFTGWKGRVDSLVRHTQPDNEKGGVAREGGLYLIERAR
jgi:hypothetical protein